MRASAAGRKGPIALNEFHEFFRFHEFPRAARLPAKKRACPAGDARERGFRQTCASKAKSLKLGDDLPALGAPWTRETVAAAMAAFELIEDRNADYPKVEALSLIVENCWNGGIVTGAPKALPAGSLAGIPRRLAIDGKIVGEGKSEDPCATLAWLANHVAERGRGLKAGMSVITGSLITDRLDRKRPAGGLHGRRARRSGDGCRVTVSSAWIGPVRRIIHGELARASSVPHLKLDSRKPESARP